MRKSIIEKLTKITELTCEINANGGNLGLSISRTSMNMFDIDNNCKAVECGVYGGYVYFDFDNADRELKRFIRFLERKLEGLL